MVEQNDFFREVFNHPLLSRIRGCGARAVSGSVLNDVRHPHVKLSVRLARKLGRNSLIEKIVRELKRGHGMQKEACIPVNSVAYRERQEAIDFVRQAKAAGLLSKRTVVFRPDVVVVRPLSQPEPISFFTGGWLEICMAALMQRFLADPRRPALVPLFRIKLESQRGIVDAEIDGAAMLRGGRSLILVEAKTRPCVPLRFIRLARALGVCLKHRILVTATATNGEIAPSECTTMCIRRYAAFLRRLRLRCR